MAILLHLSSQNSLSTVVEFVFPWSTVVSNQINIIGFEWNESHIAGLGCSIPSAQRWEEILARHY